MNSLHLNFFTVFHSFYNFCRSIEKINNGSCLVGKNEALLVSLLYEAKFFQAVEAGEESAIR